MASIVARFFIERPAFPRIMAWLVLEDRNITEEMGDHPFLRRLIGTFAEQAEVDPNTQAGVVVIMLIASAFLYSPANVALGRDRADERLIQALERMVATYAIGHSAPPRDHSPPPLDHNPQ